MARTTRLKKNDTGTAHYHLMSRANDRRFLFEKGRVKSSLIDALKRAAAFSGIGLEAYTGMDNHFHIVCEVVRSDEPVPEDELLRRVAILKGEAAAEELAERWRELRAAGLDMMVEAAQNRLRKRMNDISEFMKTFKEVFNIRFKRERGYTGSIWSGRFKSTLIEGGRYLETCRRYVYLNPVRAGLVKHAADYPWCWIAPSDEPSAERNSRCVAHNRRSFGIICFMTITHQIGGREPPTCTGGASLWRVHCRRQHDAYGAGESCRDRLAKYQIKGLRSESPNYAI